MTNAPDNEAIALARAAQAEWGATPVGDRVRRLQPAADRIRRDIQSFVDVVVEENGKPAVEVIAHELLPAVAYVRWLAGAASGLLAPTPRRVTWAPHRRVTVRRRPFGVVLVISPWNIPFLIPFTQVFAALAAGNAAVLKPSEITPRCGDLVAAALAECELPAGLFTIVHGAGDVGAALLEQRPDKVTFTGSVATGRKVMAACADHLIPVGLELGGVDALIVCEDADLEYAASAIAWGGTFNHGQVCASVERVLVHASVHDDLVDRVADKMERIDRRRELGRVTLPRQRDVIDAHLADANTRGVTVNTGGRWFDEQRLEPTLLSGAATAEALAWRDETFGPVVVARPFTDDGEAVRLHDETPYGLTASVFSANLDRARRLATRLRAGNVAINEIAAYHYSQPELPWGGVGASGFGRSHGPEGLLDLTWSQVIDESALGAAEPKRPWWYPYGHEQVRAFTSLVDATAATGLRDRLAALAATGRGVASILTRAPRN